LRVRIGQDITLFDGCGGVAEGTVESVSKSAVAVTLSNRVQLPPPSVQIDLIQAVPKPDRWEWVLQKAVELGATSIYPVLTERTENRATGKEERWRKILLNAAQQSEVRWLPLLKPLERFEQVMDKLGSYDLVLIGSLYPGTMPLRAVSFDGKTRVALLIGPEGDFTESEVAAAIEEGAVPVSFGDQILRTETAAIFGLSVLAYELL